MEFKHSVDLDSENCMGDHINNIDHEQTVGKIGKREVIIEPVDDTDFFCREYRYLC